MERSVLWIMVTVVATVILIGLGLWMGRKQNDELRRAAADEIREQLRREDTEAEHHGPIVAGSEARARAQGDIR